MTLAQSHTLIGRDAEVQHLQRVLDAAQDGRGQVLLISGEAGIGKSRLLHDSLSQRQRAVGLWPEWAMRVLTGHCYEQDRALPYAPLIDLLRGQNLTGLEDLTDLNPLARLLPELGEAPTAGEPEQDKRRLFEALTEALTPSPPPLSRRAGEGLGVRAVVIEDVHWADEASLEFLLYLARRIGSRPAVLAMTYRGDEVGPSLERFLAALDRERLATEVALRRFDATETAAMIRATFDLPRSPQADFLKAMHVLTDGNPFFIEEVLKSFVAAGEIFELGGQWGRKPLSQMRVPRTVQAAVRGRVNQLDAEAQRLLDVAAVAGQRWDFAVLQCLTGHDEATLIRHVKAMIAAQLVVEESPDAFAFRHALTRQAIYTGLLARERAGLHGAIGEALEQLYPHRLDARLTDTSATLSASLAHHFYEARNWEKTAAYARRAAEHAQRLGAPRAAAEHWTRAIEAEENLGVKPSSALRRARGQAHETLGQFDSARDDVSQALADAHSTGDTRMAWQCLLDLGFLYTSRDFQVAHDYFDRALAIARALNDPVVLAHTLNRVGNWHVNCEQPDEGEQLHREALALFEELQDPHGIAATLDLLAGALFLGGDLPAGMAHYAQAAERFRALNDRRGLSSGLVWLTHRGTVLNTMLATAPAADCARGGEEAIDLARQIDWRPGESFAMVVLGMCCARQGDYGRALSLLPEGIDIARDIEHAQGLIVGMFGLGATYLDLLALPEAQRVLTEGLALTRPVNIPFGDRLYSALLALTYVAQGEFAKARAALDAVVGATPDEMPSRPTLAQRLCWLARAELAIATGNPSDALVIVDRLIDLAKRTLRLRSPTGTSGQAERDTFVEPRLLKLRGDALAALQQTEDAETALQDALRAAEFQGARPLVWRIHAAMGRLYKTCSQRAEADTHFSAARDTIEALAGSIHDAALRERFLHHALAGIPPAPALTPLRAAKLEHDGLTEREREVAALVARGLSNRAIAEALSISQRTAGAHVGNILAKLGFAARAQIASWATEKGLDSDAIRTPPKK
jgi:DNA-binding CsgD family transcriptional regulator